MTTPTTHMRRIDVIRERLDKATPGVVRIDGSHKAHENLKSAYAWTFQGKLADAVLLVHAHDDIRWLLDTLARRDQRCEDLAASLDEMRRDLLHAERWEQEVTDVLHTVHTMCLHGDPHHQIAEYIDQHDHRCQATTKEN